ncbi:LLM class flavin-dependent oxidoreductase [Microbacterium sp. A8/3-1]|uniref:LLM class flavin-dependent oxidoreductase n=1 Tax=Microbacterium sp. A8/3-1 TaxID=3160749 RepID=A0AAU7VWE5_9MICO
MSHYKKERTLRFHLFMNGNDGYMPHMLEGKRDTNYIDLPNEEFSSPMLAQDQMRRYVSNLASGELLGFDSAVTMEQRVPAIYPSSMIIASWLLAKTSRMPIGALGPTSTTYATPIKLAEELAMLDVLSGGRIFVAFPMGTGPVYYQTGANPTTARRRHHESIRLISRALNEPGPFEHRGEFFNLPYVNLWPKPLHQIETWLPASGSRESQVEAARGRHTYVTFLSSKKGIIRYIDQFKKIAEEEFGYTPPPSQLAACVNVYVAESDAQARKEYEAGLLWFYQSVLRGNFEDSFPPGATSWQSLQGLLKGGFAFKPEDMTYDDMMDQGVAVVGSPETVARKLEELRQESGVGQMIIIGDGGGSPEWMVRKSMELFAREVMPKFRPEGGRPVWDDEERQPGYATLSEAGARWPGVPRDAIAKVGDDLYNVHHWHVDDLRKPVDGVPPVWPR